MIKNVKIVCWIIFFSFLIQGFFSCGPVGSIDEEETQTLSYSGIEPFSYTITPENIGDSFRAYHDTEFFVTHEGDCEYEFNLLLSPIRNYYEKIVSGNGSEVLYVVKDLPTGDYLIEANTECNFTIEVYSVATYDSSTGDSEDDEYEIRNCQGCCSSNGGVVCVNGYPQCRNGKPLSTVCTQKGCSCQ